MSNLALETAGAEVVTASTIDPRHPPACVIDGYVRAQALFMAFLCTSCSGCGGTALTCCLIAFALRRLCVVCDQQ